MISGQKKRVLDTLIFVARKHMRLMALLMCLAIGIGLILSAYVRSVYFSRSLVRVGLASPTNAGKNNDEHQGIVIRELTQPHILERTAARLGMKATHNDLRKNCLLNIAVRARSERDLEVDVWAYSKVWAANWTEALVQEYLEFRREKHEEKSDQTIKPSSVELPQVSETSELPIGSLPLEIARLNQRIDEMSRARINLQDSNLDLVARLSLLSSFDKSVNLKASEPIAGHPLGEQKSAPWEMLERERRAIKSQILNVSRTDPSGPAQLITLNKELERVDQDLERELLGALERFDVEYQNLLDQKAVSEARLPEYNEFRRQRARNTMDHKTAPAVQASDLGEKVESIHFTYIGLQQLHDQPVWPHRLKRVLLSLLFGGFLAVGVPFLIEDPKADDAESRTGGSDLSTPRPRYRSRAQGAG